MKQMFKRTVWCALALAGFIACNDGGSLDKDAAQMGYLALQVATTENVENVTRAQISIGEATSQYTAPAAADFSITITNEDAENIWSGLVGNWDPTTPLKEGSYAVTATYGNGSVGFNNPIFGGSATFTIVGGETIPVEIPVKLKNALVRLSFTDMFKNYYSFDKFSVTSSNGQSIEFTSETNDAAFIEVGGFTVSATLTSQAQVTSTKNFTYTAKAAQCYTIAFDASNIGGNGFTITFGDEPTETVDFGDIDVNE